MTKRQRTEKQAMLENFQRLLTDGKSRPPSLVKLYEGAVEKLQKELA